MNDWGCSTLLCLRLGYGLYDFLLGSWNLLFLAHPLILFWIQDVLWVDQGSKSAIDKKYGNFFLPVSDV